MTDNEITGAIVDAAVKIHMRFGPGLFESVYERTLEHELLRGEFAVRRQQPIPVLYEGLRMSMGFRADLMVEKRIIVELKSCERLAPVHRKQLLTYLRVTGLRCGLLLNFGAEVMREGIVRVVNNYEEGGAETQRR